MKYELLETFHNDHKRLPDAERQLFRNAIRQMNRAAARHTGLGLPQWPGALRVRPVADAEGIWEMTYSFAGPDGRATFDYAIVDDELAIRWRRIGGHRIFREP